MSHEDLRDCIDPIRTPAEQQISTLQREIASLKARLVEYPDRATLTETLAVERAEVARLTAEKDKAVDYWIARAVANEKRANEAEQQCRTLKRHLDAIAEALHPHKPKSEYTEIGMEDDLPQYLPDQLAGMVTAIKRENVALRQENAEAAKRAVQVIRTNGELLTQRNTLESALNVYRALFTQPELDERVRRFNAYDPNATAARQALDAGIKEKGE